jgi:hypothetical protein
MRLCALHELPDGTARGFDPRRTGQDSGRLCQIEIEDGSMDEHAQIMRDSLMALAQPI